MNVEPLPSGETGTELHGADALAALDDALQSIVAPAVRKLSVRNVDVKKVGRWVLMRVQWLDGKVLHDVTVRMPRARAESIRLRLSKVLGA